jgi:uncharacterized protein YdeI (YjbR/CyaY-like superfamily)
MEIKNGIQAIHAQSDLEWREWLAQHGQSEKSVWLIVYHKQARVPMVFYNEAIEQALCFGWIDSKAIKRDAQSTYLMFTPRKPNGTWSNVNKERIQRMTAKGLMNPREQALIDLARQSGAWDLLTNADNGVIPEDLQALFNENRLAFQHFQAFPRSSKSLILGWIEKAKRPETRQARIVKTVELAVQNIRANHPRAS